MTPALQTYTDVGGSMNFAVQHATTKAPKHGETENYSGRRRSITSWHVVPLWRWPGVKGSLGPLRLAAAFLRQPVRSRFPRGMEVDVSPASFVLDSGEVRESSTPKPSVLLRCLLEGRAAHSSSYLQVRSARQDSPGTPVSGFCCTAQNAGLPSPAFRRR